MAHEVEYDSIKDEFKRREQALRDIKMWLGPSRYKRVSQEALAMKMQPNARELIAATVDMIAGVNGYPVEVWLDFLGFPHQTPKTDAVQAETQATSVKPG